MKVLIIEDDLDTQEFLQKRLSEKCAAIDLASNGDVGIRKARDNYYDIILLDYALPGRDGFAIIQEVRCLPDQIKRNTPIIMISVTNELLNKVSALEYGADDYIPKPFLFAELFARMQAVLRRPHIQQSSTVALGSLVLDSNKQQVTKNGAALHLTRKEFSLLEYLMKNQGSIVTRNAISEYVWNTDLDPFSNTIEMHILNLRKKLSSKNPEHTIRSVPGRGYIIENS
jgi:two-component system OmpR family response regulator